MTRRLPLLLTALLGASLLAACDDADDGGGAGGGGSGGQPAGGSGGGDAGGSGGAGGEEPRLTYHRDVKPILDAKCKGCHDDGGIAPMPLDTFDDVSIFLPDIEREVSAGTMPPWPPADGCNDYVAPRALSAEQVTTILDWIGLGAPEGTPGSGTPIPDERVGLTRVDLSLPMAESYTPRMEDDYRCFVIDWPYGTPTYVTGFRANPGEARVVHHVIAYRIPPELAQAALDKDAGEDGPGYTCFGSSGIDGAESWLGAWAPGSLGNDFPAGTGMRMEPGSKVVIQMHYNTTTAGALPDQSSIDMKVDDFVEKEAHTLLIANPGWLRGTMDIPAGSTDTRHFFDIDIALFMGTLSDGVVPSNTPFTIYNAGLHMHQLGTRAKLMIDRQDDPNDTCLLEVPRWDFHWQGNYGFTTPVVYQPGDKLSIECHWDNSAENQPVVDGVARPPDDVEWGEGTADEMCLGIMYVTR